MPSGSIETRAGVGRDIGGEGNSKGGVRASKEASSNDHKGDGTNIKEAEKISSEGLEDGIGKEGVGLYDAGVGTMRCNGTVNEKKQVDSKKVSSIDLRHLCTSGR